MELVFWMLVLIQLELLCVGALLVWRRKSTERLEGGCFIDTSALIDGRIIDAAHAGFVPDRLVIPRSVLSELQLLADGADAEKRARARHGLDVAKALREIKSLHVVIFEDKKDAHDVDGQLLKLAREHSGSICTIDYNLNKVASAEQIAVLNVNELAKNLRMTFLPGERVSIAVTQKGSDAHQGVGYMADGTMVVIEQAKADIGKVVAVEVIRSIQTDAGRMLFAKKVGDSTSTKSRTKKPSGQSRQKNTRRPSRNTSEDRVVELANTN